MIDYILYGFAAVGMCFAAYMIYCLLLKWVDKINGVEGVL